MPPEHLARFVVDSVAQLDLSALYAQYGPRGGEPYAPEVLLGVLLYGYATRVFSSRKIERATYEAVPFRFIAGNLHPDHDTLVTFRRTFLPELKDLFVQILLLAQEAGVLKLGMISLDGTKVHADASKRKAVSFQRATHFSPHQPQQPQQAAHSGPHHAPRSHLHRCSMGPCSQGIRALLPGNDRMVPRLLTFRFTS
ncbi:transposase [Ktedonobacter sp. SOSP1-52]|uniref:transposase n=1 Tax=Ktedonobacter sp. SOSP1-52 TaxID=2778366 RepID=UPI0019160704